MAQYNAGYVVLTSGLNTVIGKQKALVSGISGTFQDGETGTFSGGGTCSNISPILNAESTFVVTARTPLEGETLTGDTSGAVCTLNEDPELTTAFQTNISVTSVGPFFTRKESNWWSAISSVVSEQSMLLNLNWPNATVHKAEYVVHDSFSPRHDLKVIGQGDSQTAALVNDSMLLIDSRLDALRSEAVSSDRNVTRVDVGKVFLVDTSGGVVTLTLPNAATVGAGFMFRMMVVDSTNNAVVSHASETINGASQDLVPSSSPYTTRTYFTDGTNWYVY